MSKKMKFNIEIFKGKELLYGAYQDGNVSVLMDTPTLKQVEKVLDDQVAYLRALINEENTFSMGVESGGDLKGS
jgi:hypothetical protein